MDHCLTLQEIKQSALAVLRHFASFCRENHIAFYLSNGTLLGAVKYGGFIPWDDDVDVLVPRKDYEKLLKLYEDSEEYVLYAPERNKQYLYPFAKLCDRKTILVENNYDNGVSLGVNIDIFPLDVWASEYKKACKQVRWNCRMKKFLGFAKIQTYIPASGRSKLQIVFRKGVLQACRWIGPVYFSEQMKKMALRYCNLSNPCYMGCVIWPVYEEREILPAHVFEKNVMVTFEGESYPAPAEYDQYLRSLYGNYEEDPPIHKQVTHHNFTVYLRGL